jgi:hypothetical protein
MQEGRGLLLDEIYFGIFYVSRALPKEINFHGQVWMNDGIVTFSKKINNM